MIFNYFAAIDIFNLSLVGCGIVFGVALVLLVLFMAVQCKVTYIDSEDEKSEIHKETHPWLSKVDIHSANKTGKRLVGWSTTPNGKTPLTKHRVVLFRSIKLYAIWANAPAPQAVPVTVAEAPVAFTEVDYKHGIFVKFNYINPQTEEIITSEGFKLNAVVPQEEVDGWALEPNGSILLKDGTETHVFNIDLYPVSALADSGYVAPTKIFTGKSVVDLSYTITGTDTVVYKESHYLTLKLPNSTRFDRKFIGWSTVADGDANIERTDVDCVFNIPLFSVGDAVAEEPVVEEAVEEIAPEVIIEEPAPVYEEIIEEYIPQPVQEVTEEPAIESEPITKEPVAEPVVEEAPAVEEPAPVVEEPAEPVLIPTYYDNEGNKIDIKYSRSFTANLIQSDDTVKDYYSELKNHILSYKGVKSRISWKFDSYNRGRDQLFKIKLRGKTICLYCALNPEEFDQSKYHHEPIDAKIFEDVPMLVKIKSGLGLRKAKELVDIVMAKFEIEKDEKAKVVDYVKKHPYEPNEPLIARKLIKALVADDAVVVMSSKPKDAVVEAPVVEPVVEEPVAEPVVEEAPAVEEPVAEPAVEEAPAVEEPVAEPVVEEAPAVEEPVVVPVVEEPVEEPYVEPEIVVESVSAEEAHQIIEENHIEIHIEEGVDYIRAGDSKKAIVNIDTLSKNYNAGDVVTIQSMKDKKLIEKKAKCVKVLARGILDKPLKIMAGEFSGTAVEMILLTGGQAMHVEYKVK